MTVKQIPKGTSPPRDGSFGKPGLMSAPLVELTQKLGNRNGEIEEIAKRGREVLPNIIMVLRMGTDYNRACALACMMKIDSDGVDCREAIPELRELLKSGGYVKGYATNLLGRMKDEESVQEIAKGLGDMEYVVRLYSSAALEALGPASVEGLVKALGGKNEFTRREARRVLLRISLVHPGSVPNEVLAAIEMETAEEIARKSHGILKPKHLDTQVIL